MKKWIVVTLLAVILSLAFIGCTSPTSDNPFGIKDPNEVAEWIELGTQIGQGAVAVGTTTGNPYALAWGGGLVALGGVLATILLKKGKTNGES